MGTGRRRAARGAAAIAIALAAGLGLSGCDAVTPWLHEQFPDHFGPLRGDDGEVLKPTLAHSIYVQLGDCLSFPDLDDRTRVELIPCDEQYDFEVIGYGTLTKAEVADKGMQAALQTRCEPLFFEFKDRAPEGSRPDMQFLVVEAEVDGLMQTNYSCLASLRKIT